MGKKWMKGRFWHTYGLVVKPNPIKYNENLDIHGFQSGDSKAVRKRCLEALIRRGVPCMKHNSYYLKEWRVIDSF